MDNSSKFSDLVLVTGASGYLATSIVKKLLEDGYKVRGTVRSLKNEDKIAHLKGITSNSESNLELIEANLLNEECWKDAVKDCKYVIHVASPFPSYVPSNSDDLIKPALDGTRFVLKACSQIETVKRVVITSSCVAVYDSSLPIPKEKEEGKLFTEEDWTNVDDPHLDTYAKSKTLAEKEAWNYVNQLKDGNKFDLVTINPGLILGPLYSKILPTSVDLVKRLLSRDVPAVAKLGFPVVDVRDVALAHVKALTSPEAAGKRHIIVSASLWMKDVASILEKEFKPQGYNIPTMVAPNIFVWMTSFIDKSHKIILPRLSRESKYDNSRMVNVLGISPIDPQKSIIDTANSLIELGLVNKPKKAKKSKKEEEKEEIKEGKDSQVSENSTPEIKNVA